MASVMQDSSNVVASKAEQMGKRLAALDEARKADVAKRRQENDKSLDPRENVGKFLSEESAARADISARLDSLSSAGGGEATVGEIQKLLSAIVTTIGEAEQRLAESTYFLPGYDSRTCNAHLAALRERARHVSSLLVPRKKFSFSKNKRRAAEVAAAEQARLIEEQKAKEGEKACASKPVSEAPGVRGVKGGVVVVSAAEIKGGEFVIEDVEGAEVWLCGPIGALYIHRVRDSKVYTGPVSGAALVEDTSSCTFMLASAQIRIHHTHNTSLYLRVRSNPIIEYCTGVGVAPYKVAYPGSEGHMKHADLDKETNLWNQVNDFRWLKSTPSPNWRVLPLLERAPLPVCPGSAAELCQAATTHPETSSGQMSSASVPAVESAQPDIDDDEDEDEI